MPSHSRPVGKRLSGSTTAVIQIQKVKQSESKDIERRRESLTGVRHEKQQLIDRLCLLGIHIDIA
jgi:hypothetical protein